jgi:hypothetical protein
VAISTTTDDQLSWRFALLGFIAKDVTAGREVDCPMARTQKKSPDPGIRAF